MRGGKSVIAKDGKLSWRMDENEDQMIKRIIDERDTQVNNENEEWKEGRKLMDGKSDEE